MNERKPLSREERLQLARKAYKQFYAQCFWSYRSDLPVTESLIPLIVRELRHNGGHAGYKVAGESCP